jgi:hypothetical protein
LPAKTFQNSRPDAFLCVTKAEITAGDLVRPAGVAGIERYPAMVPADADWQGPLYIAREGRRPGTKVFCVRYEQLLNADVAGVDDLPTDVPLDGVVVYLADGGKLATTGTRPVGSLCGHPDKGPIAHLEPAACAALGPSGAVATCGACSGTSEPAAGPVSPSEAKETSTRRVRRKSKTPKE